MDKILVTGANGFVGRILCDTLRKKGGDVIAAVRTKRSAGEFQTGDLSEVTDWTDALAGVKTVIHLAARVHVLNDTAHNPLAAFRAVNVDGTLNLATQAAKSGVKRFVFISSIGVNGAATFAEPFTELSTPRPHSPYAVSKLEAEEGLKDVCRKAGMEFVIVRPPLVYGPGAPGNFATLLKLVHRRFPLPLGSVSNRRSMIALENLVDFITLCADTPAAANQLFLVADGEDVSTPSLIRSLAAGMGVPARLFCVPLWVLDAGARATGKRGMFQQLCGSLQLDTRKATNLLEWKPPATTDEALRRAAQGYLKGPK